MSELTKLVGSDETQQAGNFVLQSQATAGEAGFRNVSQIWYNKTRSYQDGLAQLEKGKAETEDITATVAEIQPTVTIDGKFAMQYKDGRTFRPTKHAMLQMGNWADTGTWYVQSLLENPTNNKGKELYQRDVHDAQTLVYALANGFRRLDPTKKFLWRTRKDGSLRAMLTDRYAIVDNRWFVELLAKLVPGGRLSHWRGDSDTIYGNVLIPDTIRAESDSDYGGMLSIGNSEIGERRVSSMPSIFRAICMNGCIWGQVKGENIRQVHRGKIDLDALAKEIQTNLEKQIPLLPRGIEALLGTRAIGWDGATVSAKPVFAQLAKDFKFSKHQASAVLKGYLEERQITPEYATTLFGITNAITRAGQSLDNAGWVAFDGTAGEIIRYTADDLSSLVGRAAKLKEKDVEEMFLAA